MTERNRPIAEKTIIVRDDAMGINRRVIAGQAIPPDLVGAYRKATSNAAHAADESGDGNGKQDDDLDMLSRTALDERAVALGIIEPDKLPNKGAVIDAINAAQAADES